MLKYFLPPLFFLTQKESTMSEQIIIVRILLAAVIGGVVGWERELHGQVAGLRTHIIVAVGSALASVLSILMAGNGNDPARIAAQVISGIGFLGGGAILHYGTGVKGLTTAASLWTVAIIGLAMGAGYLLIGGVTGLIILITLSLLNQFENRFIHAYKIKTAFINANERPNIQEEIKKVVQDNVLAIVSTSIEKQLSDQRIRMEFVTKMANEEDGERLINALSSVKGIKTIKIH